ncbi:MAG: hypothetical protein ILO53_01980 [Clostridia bacterium]|nr:hypothetical protein [Clostridia bacterium]
MRTFKGWLRLPKLLLCIAIAAIMTVPAANFSFSVGDGFSAGRRISQGRGSSALQVYAGEAPGPVTPVPTSPPTVDPKTTRQHLYVGEPKIGTWLSIFEDDGSCKGNVYVVFNAARPFHQIGIPVLWAGTPEHNTDVMLEFRLFAFSEDDETTLRGEPLFADEQHISHDNGYGIIIPMQEFFPAGQYIFSVSQTSGVRGEARPYAVIPNATSAYPDHYLRFGGTGDAPVCIYIDFLEDASADGNYLLPLKGSKGGLIVSDEPIPIIEHGGHDPHAISDDEEFAMLSPLIPEDKILQKFIFLSAPTWSNVGPGSNLGYTVYEWTGNYKSSLEGPVLASGTVVNHKDNDQLTLNLGISLTGGKQYLIVTKSVGTFAIGFWQGTDRLDSDAPWAFYENGRKSKLLPSCAYVLASIVDPVDDPSGSGTGEGTPLPPASGGPSDAATQPPANTSGGCGSSLSAAAAALCPAVLLPVLKGFAFVQRGASMRKKDKG